MKEALMGLLGSKKALAGIAASVASALVVLAGQKGWAIDPAAAETLVTVILGIAAAYIGGQGIADWGKEKAKIEKATTELVTSAEKKPADPEALEF